MIGNETTEARNQTQGRLTGNIASRSGAAAASKPPCQASRSDAQRELAILREENCTLELTISTLKTRNTGLALTVDRLKSSATEEDYEALRASHEAMTAAHSKLNATHRDTSAKLKALEKKSERLSYDLNIATEGYTEAVKLLAAKPTDEVTNASDGKLDRESNQRSGGTTGESYEALRTQYETIAAAHSELDVTHQNTLAKLKSLEQSNEQLAYELSIATASYAEAVQLLDTKHAVEVTEALDGKLIRESYQRLGTSVLQVLECEVCYNIIEAPYMLSCGHTFCMGCLQGWFKTVYECPMCRGPVQTTPIRNYALQAVADAIVQHLHPTIAAGGNITLPDTA